MSETYYRLAHRTVYSYAAPVTLSHQRLHLTPREVPFQHIHSHEITITPTATQRLAASDAFGNALIEATIEAAHTELEVVAVSRISVNDRQWPQPQDTPAWETVRDALQYRAGWHADDDLFAASQYLFESPHVRLKRQLRGYVADCFTPGRPILEGADALMAKIHRDFRFDPKATTINTPVMTVFKQRSGVCQDFSHLMISCLRSIGLAARYMSGYLVTSTKSAGESARESTKPADPELVGADASHAWVALFIPGTGWVELDPTNNVRPSRQHVVLGWGRDFSDVTPLRGVINAGCEQTLKVTVTLVPDGMTSASTSTSTPT